LGRIDRKREPKRVRKDVAKDVPATGDETENQKG